MGSCDGGVTVYNEDHSLLSKVRTAAKLLNLKNHLCGMNAHSRKELYTPLDLEGHLGSDGKHYLLDFSRVMPPEYPRFKST